MIPAMKRHLLIPLCLLALLFTALPGCVDPQYVGVPDEDSVEKPMLFSAGMMTAMVADTKAGTFPNDKPDVSLDVENNLISLFGYRNINEQVIFDYQDLKYSGDAWTYTPLQYWKHSGNYQFMAVHPKLDRNTCSYSPDQGRLVSTYLMHGDDYDLKVADASRLDMAYRYPEKTTPVELKFKHACAAVRFLFCKGSDAGNNDYYLHSFELQKVHTVGALLYDAGTDITTASWYVAEYLDPRVFEWEAASAAENKTIPSNYANYVSTYFGKAGEAVARWHYVIPQELTAGSAAINFSVLVNENTDTAIPVYTTLNLPAITWEPGKVYTYYIQIQPGSADITVTTIPWDEYSVASDDIIF